jgi:hypothetical protein
MLAFVTPDVPLLPGAGYTLFVQQVGTSAGDRLEIEAVSFSTRILNPAGAGGPLANQQSEGLGSASTQNSAPAVTPQGNQVRVQAAAYDAADDEVFMPTPNNYGGRWRTGRPLPKAIARQINTYVALKGSLTYEQAFKARSREGFRRFVKAASAPSGAGVAGQVLRLNDQPLSDVVVTIGGLSTRSDAEGYFQVNGLAPGRYEIYVDGSKAGGSGREYGKFLFGVDVEPGQKTQLPPVYLPRIRQQDWVSIPAPIQRDLIVTHPNVPGMEIYIPKGAVLRDREGRIVTQISLVPLPLDRVPFPFPENAPVYVSVQPGGLIVQGLSPETSGGIRVVYPNLSYEEPGARADFWRAGGECVPSPPLTRRGGATGAGAVWCCGKGPGEGDRFLSSVLLCVLCVSCV